ncbi:hypothetical protein V8E36_008509 [Tilletia maclaganii]
MVLTTYDSAPRKRRRSLKPARTAAAAAIITLFCLSLAPSLSKAARISAPFVRRQQQMTITSSNSTAEITSACDCGFIDTSAGADTDQIFNSFFKADFTTMDMDDLRNGFRFQNYSIARAGTSMARDFKPENANLCPDGICLLVKPADNETHVPSGGVYTKSNGYHFGNYYAEVKVPAIAGTVSAFYIYLNDNNEVDMEYNNPTHAANESIKNTVKPQIFGNNGPSPLTYFQTFPPPGVDPSEDFHTWSFKWNASQLYFGLDGDYGDNVISTNVPQLPGVLSFSHWSDGNPYYSGGPPTQQVQLTFRRSWAYWNNASLPASLLPCQKSSAPCRFDARGPLGSTTDVITSGGTASAAAVPDLVGWWHALGSRRRGDSAVEVIVAADSIVTRALRTVSSAQTLDHRAMFAMSLVLFSSAIVSCA